MIAKLMIVTVAAIVGYALGDYLEPKIITWLKLSPDNKIGVKAVKYGTVGALAAGAFWLAEKYVK